MLVLTRKKGQSILIGDNIEVKILDIKGNYVSVGVSAPRDVNVFRNELLEGSNNSKEETAPSV